MSIKHRVKKLEKANPQSSFEFIIVNEGENAEEIIARHRQARGPNAPEPKVSLILLNA